MNVEITGVYKLSFHVPGERSMKWKMTLQYRKFKNLIKLGEQNKTNNNWQVLA